MQLVRQGYSWSGHERNICYLGEGDGRFANVSVLSGLDFPDDGRAMAVVDWDQDGDLDLWLRNRTAPRLRLMLNQLDASDRRYVSLRLEGTRSNRDGIGAVVEVVTEPEKGEPPPGKLVKSLRAGDLFLSQSSKSLHFGLGDAARIREVRVLWPGSTLEVFQGVHPNGQFILKQGSGVAIEWRPSARRESSSLSGGTSAVKVPDPGETARIVLPMKIPFPRIGYREVAGVQSVSSPQPRARLVLVWSSSCPHCRAELEELATNASALREAGLDVLALCIDELQGLRVIPGSRAHRSILEAGFSFPWGILDAASAERIQHWQGALFDRSPDFTVPLGFLMDREANAVAVYRGRVSSELLVRDVRRLLAASRKERHHMAPPLAGTWFTRPVDEAAMAEFMARQFQDRLPEDALPYLDRAVAVSTGERQAALRSELIERQHAFARRYQKEKQPERAAFYFESALQHAPHAAALHYDYGIFLAAYGKLGDAEVHLRRALEIQPDLEAARVGLNLVLKLKREGG